MATHYLVSIYSNISYRTKRKGESERERDTDRINQRIMSDDDDDEKTWTKLADRKRGVSFDERKNTYYKRTAHFYDEFAASVRGPEWAVISPMTRHVFPSEHSQERSNSIHTMSPANIPRRRSRSFNDVIETQSDVDYSDFPDITTPTSSWGQHESNGEKDSEHSRSQRSDDNGNDDSYYEISSTNGGKNSVEYDEDDDMPIYMAMLYGGINCTIVVPVIMSFGNIIYRDDAFADYMPILIKLTLFSGTIHQLCFSSFSTLKFAVGSVQDAGLIFLSKMAADMVQYCRANGHDNETMMATVTVGLGCATAALGVGLIIIGKLGLASYVQMLPTCVVAGYLAYIGWFVGYSGLGIMAEENALTPALMIKKFIYVVPGIAGGALIYVSVRKFRHVAVLPLCITFLLVIFYVILAVTGTSIEDATDNGWIRKSVEQPAWYQTWDYLKLDKVVWSALPQLWLTWSGMLFVVALSSSLDVAAIELEVKKPLNYNKELGVVGISNLVSGLTGGYTGSYIFSQTIFSLRIGVRSRVAGFSIALFQLIIILCPFPLLAYVPNFFYGSLLSMICIDLVYEWLWEFRAKVTTAEYIIGLSTFGLIQVLGVEYGIIAGVAVYVICRQLKINVGELKTIYVEENDEGSIEETTQLLKDADGVNSYST